MNAFETKLKPYDKQFKLPEENQRYLRGEFTGTLAFRCRHRNKPMLLYFFDADDGRKIVLQA